MPSYISKEDYSVLPSRVGAPREKKYSLFEQLFPLTAGTFEKSFLSQQFEFARVVSLCEKGADYFQISVPRGL